MTDVLDRLKAALADRYTIERELGRGGMATVYLAEDLKHHRHVAIKVLDPELARALGGERFLREVEVTANLTHPHILTLIDSGEADGFLYYVMPYIEGETLRERMNREGQLPLEDALQITKEVAAALSHAHSHDVVHRDIKPENVLLSAGEAVVADFGIARAITKAGGEHLTETGISIGTPAYMSPEQASGAQKLDGRSDVYSLGCVLYEMLAGEPPYTGPTAQAVLAKKLSEPTPRVSVIRERVPSGVEAAIDQALAKAPADRFATVGQFTEAITAPREALAPQPKAKIRHWLVPGILAATLLIVIGVVLLRTMASRPISITASDTRRVTRASGIEIDPAISRDGRWVAYTAESERGWHLFVRDLGGRTLSLTADRPGSQVAPRWTTDGLSVVFFEAGAEAEGGAHRVPRLGGPANRILDHRIWDVRNNHVVYLRHDSLLIRAIEGGEESFVAFAPSEPHSVIWSPDGSKLAYVQGNIEWIEVGSIGNVAPSSVWIVGVDSGEPVQVTDDTKLNVSPVWMPDGRHLLFISNRDGPRDIYAVQLDDSGRPRNQPERVTHGLNPHSISLSADGSVVAYSQLTYRGNIWEIAIPEDGGVSISGAAQVTFDNQIVEAHGLSRDGRRLAFDSNQEGFDQDIYVMPVEGGEATRLTSSPGADLHPDFSPDGSEIAFYSPRHGTRDVFLISADGTDEIRLTDDPSEDYHPSFSPDGLSIAFTRDAGVYVMSRGSADGAWTAPELLTPNAKDRFSSRWSPDASQIAHASVSARWSPDGRQIVYTSPSTNQLWIVPLRGEEWLLFDVGTVGLFTPEWPDWSLDSRFIYFTAGDSTGTWGLYTISVEGGALREVVLFDDPTKSYQRLPYTLGQGKAYFTLTERESDIYVMDLEW